MTQEQLRHYLSVVRRQWWLVLQAVLVVGIAAGWMASRQPASPWQASASVLVTPDPDADYGLFFTGTNSAFLSSQARVMRSSAVLEAAAAAVPGETPERIAQSLSVGTERENSLVIVRVTRADPDSPVAVANAMADAFVDNRRTERTRGLQARADELARQLSELENRISVLNEQITTNAALGRDTSTLQAGRDAALQQYQGLFSSQQDVLNQITLQRTPAEVLDRASVASQSLPASPLRRGLVGAALGLVLGVGAALLRELLDDKVRTRAAVEAAVERPVLVELPDEKLKGDRPIPVVDHPHGPLAESIRGLRTSLRFLAMGQPLRTVAVTSPQPGDGKSLTSVNLAAAYAQAGMRTVLVSGDLRKPSVDVLFGLEDKPGLTDVLVDTFAKGDDLAAAIEAALQPTPVEHLFVLPAGPLPPNPAELLSSERAQKLFAALPDLAEMVVVDSPPTVVSDAAVIAGLVDGTVLVVALNRTAKAKLAKAVEILRTEPLRLLGVALNRTASKGGYYGYGAYGGYRPQQDVKGKRQLPRTAGPDPR